MMSATRLQAVYFSYGPCFEIRLIVRNMQRYHCNSPFLLNQPSLPENPYAAIDALEGDD